MEGEGVENGWSIDGRTFSDDHADGFGRDADGVVDATPSVAAHTSSIPTVTPPSAAHARPALRGATLALARQTLGVTVDNLHDQLLGHRRGLRRSNEIDGTEAIGALRLADDVDVTARALLEVADRLTPASDDQTHGTVGHHDLHAILTLSQSGLMGARARAGLGAGGAVGVQRGARLGILFHHLVDFVLGMLAGRS